MTLMFRVTLTTAILTLSLAACSAPESVEPRLEPTPQSAPTMQTLPALSDTEMIQRAESAAKNSLPDAPIWEGMTFEGVVVNDSTVCVDRTWRTGGGIDGKGGNAGYVMVTFPEESLGEPQDGLCADASTGPASQPKPPVEVPDELQNEPGLVSRDDLGDDWPLTVDYAVLACKSESSNGVTTQIATLAAPDGTVYALNGAAQDRTDYAEIGPIWADDPDIDGVKINIGPLIDRAREFC